MGIMTYHLNLKEVTFGLSEALDLVGIDDTLHGKRVAYMASSVGKNMGWPQERIDRIIFIGMLHDCGVSSTDVHSHLINELDWDNSQIHCVRGHTLLSQTELYHDYALAVRYHHTHFDALPNELSAEVQIESNLIYLVDRVDALRAQMNSLGIKSKSIIQNTILKYSGSMFNPDLVTHFMNVSERDSFWFYLEEEALYEYFHEWIIQSNQINITFKTLKEIALLFAAVVDAKSNYTSEHSIGVASLSRYLAKLLKLPKNECEIIELAGLLHDLGKLKVDDSILNKPNKLNADERLLMNRHGFDSDIILKRIKGFKEIAFLASLHHETLDAKGYPYGLNEKEIPFAARIIAVADIFQALIQNRPYREGLSIDEALEIINSMATEGKLDSKIVQVLANHAQECLHYATVNYDFMSSTNSDQ